MQTIYSIDIILWTFLYQIQIILKLLANGPLDNEPALLDIFFRNKEAASQFMNQWYPSSLNALLDK